MNSMKRTTCGVPRKRAASASIACSFWPRTTTQLILIGEKPRGFRSGDAGEHAFDVVAAAAHACERRGIERVEADRHALQARAASAAAC